MLRRWMRSCVVLLAVASLFTIQGARAAYQYATGTSVDGIGSVHTAITNGWQLSPFPQTPDGALQGLLVDKLLNGTEQHPGIGLNTPNSYINQQIKKRYNSLALGNKDTIGNMDYYSADEFAPFLSDETADMTFLLYFPNGPADEYYLFTTSVNLGSQNNMNYPVGTYIYPIYRTLVRKNAAGEYEAVECLTGRAKSMWYKQWYTGTSFYRYPSFDPASWLEGEIP